MKTCMAYGAGMAILSLLLTLTLYFLGYHTDPEGLGAAQLPSTLVGLAIAIGGLVLGIRARRRELAPQAPFGYGRALGTGMIIGTTSAILTACGNLVYIRWINPDLMELQLMAMRQQQRARGMDPAVIAQAENVARLFMHPVIQWLSVVASGVIFSLIISLIAAAFLRRRDTLVAPPVLPS